MPLLPSPQMGSSFWLKKLKWGMLAPLPVRYFLFLNAIVLILIAVKMYLFAMAGQYPSLFFTLFLGGVTVNQSFVALRTWMLGYWAKQYDILPAEEVNVVL